MVTVNPIPARTGAQSKRWLKVAEVAAELDVSEPTLYRAIRAGEFPAVRIRGRYVIPAKVLEELETAAIATGLVDAAEATQTPAERGWSR